jgi:hypothetical protein
LTQLEKRGWHTGEEEIDVIASDLMTELRGRIDRGAGLGIMGGLWDRVRSVGNLSIETCSEAMDD